MKRRWDDPQMLDILGKWESANGTMSLAQKVLTGIGFSGLVVVGMVAPGLLRAVEAIASGGIMVDKRKVAQKFQYLKRKGLVVISKAEDGSNRIALSEKGKKQLALYCLEAIEIKRSKMWDKKWRVVIFDIPVVKNSARIRLRKILKKVGFKQVQKSIWIIPYRCEDEIFYVVKVLRIEKYVDILIVKEFYNDAKYKKLFFKKM